MPRSCRCRKSAAPIAPKGFTRRYGNTIAARVGSVRRDGLDACVYKGTAAPKDKTPPPSKAPRELPGEEYETATPPPPEPSVDETAVDQAPVSTDANAIAPEPAPVEEEPAATQPPEQDTTVPPVTEPQRY